MTSSERAERQCELGPHEVAAGIADLDSVAELVGAAGVTATTVHVNENRKHCCLSRR
jgi:hypothetical protein